MSFPFFIAKRYLTARSKRSFISIISLMSVMGVAIGVAALVIVMSVYNGVTQETQDKILGANPHIMVMSSRPGAFNAPSVTGEGESTESPVLAQVRQMPGVTSAVPFLYAEVLLFPLLRPEA